MADNLQEQVHQRLAALSRGDNALAQVQKLLWTDLEYDRANTVLSTREWPDRARAVLAPRESPRLIAQHEAASGSFDIVYTKLAPMAARRDFPLSLASERLVVDELLPNHAISPTSSPIQSFTANLMDFRDAVYGGREAIKAF